jgi:hypothetical protein
MNSGGTGDVAGRTGSRSAIDTSSVREVRPMVVRPSQPARSRRSGVWSSGAVAGGHGILGFSSALKKLFLGRPSRDRPQGRVLALRCVETTPVDLREATGPGRTAEPAPFRERRREARYIPASRRAQFGWWDDGSLWTAEARIENLSRGGAALLVDDFAIEAKTVLLRFPTHGPSCWHAARIVATSRSGGSGRIVRLALALPLPYELFKAVVWGLSVEEPPPDAAIPRTGGIGRGFTRWRKLRPRAELPHGPVHGHDTAH